MGGGKTPGEHWPCGTQKRPSPAPIESRQLGQKSSPSEVRKAKEKSGITSGWGQVGVQDLAGAPGSEVVGGNGLAVPPVEHQLVAVFLGLEVGDRHQRQALC